MQLLQLRLPDYRGLRDFALDLESAVDKGQAIAVLIGPNGGGKSRILHAIAELFGALYRCALGHSGRTDFGYEVRYRLRDTTVEIVQPSAEADPVMWVTDAAGSRDETPRPDWLRHLPDHVFGYQVHGRVPRGSEFERHVHFAEAELATWREQWTESWFAWQDRPENEEGVWSEQLELPITCPLYAPGFLCTPDWLPLILLSLAAQWADVFGDYLRDQARVDGVLSATLHLRAPASVEAELSALPYWGLGGPPRALFTEAAASGRFGPVPESDPLYSAGTPDDGFALTMSSPEDLFAFRNLFDSDLSMFGLLSTLQMAGYLTVDVRVRKADGAVVRADQLSSGEQQILTVLGLLRLQRGQESLFLLDEPDAHFHPEWSRRWYSSVQSMLGDGQRSQFIAATHEPLLVSNMLRQQIRVLDTDAGGRTTALVPETAPRGQGAGGLLTSDLFRLQSQLDEHTQDLIDTQYRLIPVAEDDPEARQELQEVTDQLDGLGFATWRRDKMLSSFLAELHRRRTELVERARNGTMTGEELETTARVLFDERFSRGGLIPVRHVDNSGLTAPQKWAERAAKEVAKLYTEAKDADKELSFREMWREEAIRNRLIALIGEKCWYCETRFVRSPYHVDHYRPKSVVVGEAERRGYWWLAYDPANYRLSCHHCNSGGARYGNQSAGPGKGARFPLLGQRASEGGSLDGELPVLLDPVVAEDAELMGFDGQGYARRRPERPYSKDEVARDLCRVDETIRMLALNSDLLIESRSTLIGRVDGLVQLHLASGGHAGAALYARTELDHLTRTTAEWSAAASAAERLAVLTHDHSGDDAPLEGGAGDGVAERASDGTEPPAATATGHRIDLRTLVSAIPPEAFSAGGIALTGRGKRGPARATLLADGSIMCFQRPLATPTSAARMATGDDQVDGWTFWSLTVDGTTRTLSDLRDFLIAQNG